MEKIILKITCYTFLMLFTSICLVSAQDAGERIKILSYNIHHCNPPSKPDFIDVAAIAKVIKTSEADLVALQEVDVYTERSGTDLHQAKELAASTGMFYYFVKTIDHQGGDYGIAILSKFPIIDSASYKLPFKEGTNGEQRGVAAVTVQLTTGNKIKFICTHLDFTKGNALVQAAEINRLFQKEELPVILCGDFNAIPTSEALLEFQKVFTNSCRDQCGYTVPQINPRRTIDYILFDKKDQIGVQSHSVISETYASDHLPVLAELIIK